MSKAISSSAGFGESSEIVALSTSDHKHAALLFDRIVPLHSRSTVPAAVQWSGFWDERGKTDADRAFERTFEGLCGLPLDDKVALPTALRSTLTFIKHDSAFLDPLFRPHQSAGPFTIDELNKELGRFIWIAKEWADAWNIGQIVFAVLRNHIAIQSSGPFDGEGLTLVPLLGETDGVAAGLPEGDDASLYITLSGVRLVDTTNLAWDHILEFRKDGDARRQLRNLRLFLADNCENKSASYIQDKLEQRVDEYHSACRKHGFSLATSFLKAIVDPATSLGPAAVAAAAILAGDRHLVDLAVVGGTLLKTAQFALEVGKAKHDLAQFKKSHEVAYIVRARQELQSSD